MRVYYQFSMAASIRSTQIHTAKDTTLLSATSSAKDERASDSVLSPFSTKTGKRKADSDLPHPPQRRRAYYDVGLHIPCDFQAISQVHATYLCANEEDVTSSPPTPTPQSPSTSSLDDLIRQHRGRLYVHPLQWTSQHLHILGCQFVTQSWGLSPPLEEITPSDPNQDLRPRHTVIVSPDARKALKLLWSEINNKTVQRLAMDYLMAAYGFVYRKQPSSSGHDLLPLGYGTRAVASLKVDRVFSHSSASAAYLDLDHLESLRTDTVYTSWHRKLFMKWPNNKPVEMILQTKLRRIQPSTPQYDPFILAVLVALAQGRRRFCLIGNAASTPSAILKPDASTRSLRHVIDPMASSMQVSLVFSTQFLSLRPSLSGSCLGHD